MTVNEIKEALFQFISDEINVETIVGIEPNGGGNIWIDLEDGTTKSLSLIDCTP